jgi:hypothetical protein
MASKKNYKYLEINVTKEVKEDLYNGKYKTLKKLEKTLEDGKTSHLQRSAELIL